LEHQYQFASSSYRGKALAHHETMNQHRHFALHVHNRPRDLLCANILSNAIPFAQFFQLFTVLDECAVQEC
jgi:hypothetical protein